MGKRHLDRRGFVLAAGASLLPFAGDARAGSCSAPPPPAKVFLSGFSFPENPRWHDGDLWFADIHAHKVFRATPTGKLTLVATLEDRASGLGFLPDGTLIVVGLLDRKLWAVAKNGAVRVHADISHLSRGFINDMIVDGKGRAYVGSRNGGTPESATDTVILVTPDGQSRVAAEKMISPNGSVVMADGKQLIVAETSIGRLTRFDIAADGSLSNRTAIAQIDGHHIDGLCMDAAGTFWGGGTDAGLLRIGADGNLTRVIPFPGRMMIGTAIGGPKGRTLYLTTTSPKLIDNLKHIGNDRGLDSGVNSEGRIETIDLDGTDC